MHMALFLDIETDTITYCQLKIWQKLDENDLYIYVHKFKQIILMSNNSLFHAQ